MPSPYVVIHGYAAIDPGENRYTRFGAPGDRGGGEELSKYYNGAIVTVCKKRVKALLGPLMTSNRHSDMHVECKLIDSQWVLVLTAS